MKSWLKTYDDGVPAEINPDRYSSITALFEEASQIYANNVAYECFGKTMTYAEVEAKSRAVAAYLQTTMGVQRGDRIALMCPNIFAFPIAMLGILRAGAVQVNVNPMYTARELEHQLVDADVDKILIFGGSTPVLAEIIGNTPVKTVVTIDLGDGIGLPIPTPPVDDRLTATLKFSDLLIAGEGMDYTPAGLTGQDNIFFQYTGGTTGPSKGAVLSHRNVVANLEQYKAHLPEATKPNEEVMVCALPLYHIFGLTTSLAYLSLGGRIILIPNPRDIDALVTAIKGAGITVFPAVNTLFAALSMHPGTKEVDFSRLKVSIGGGSAVIETTSQNWKALTGSHITEGYGLSETAPVLTLVPIGVSDFTGSCGLPIPSTDIILLGDDGAPVALGERGEICAKGPQVMAGYWNKPEANAESFTADGYFRTGDIGVFDAAGFLRIVDRKKDMILVSGFNVFPNEIEAVVTACPGVAECACVGVPHDKTGEAVSVFVVKAPGADLSDETVMAHCRENLTGYKVPHLITFLAELPKSNVGKILRRKLRVV
ncbi:long-chain-fatty-acid--CoA ligase [Parasedimentitalea marina]|uniref:Long-chain-fatty-acid--CoA ligase n=1 Tax=Parasedimentitalea marina TaxID=2483033 RepID=A0A3T0N5K4_9RHOB|nr:AMP-binding protein [Parasedimentitalea marina]AZV79308.1 long-chain-fatty-acid--CoA ligase [Parasedimentitalea marina]